MNSKIILCKNIKLDKNYTNVLSYSEQEMLTLCENNLVAYADNYSFIKENNNKIRVGFTYQQCLTSNYIAFQNPRYSNKWFFAFVDEVEYISDNACDISFTIDIWSTWFSKLNIADCFVSREHVNDDTIGAHTIQENIDVGTLISDYESYSTVIGAQNYYWLVIACNYNPADSARYAGIGSYAGYPQGNMWFGWLINTEDFSEDGGGLNEVSEWIFKITKDGHANDIQSIFALPYQSFSIGDVDSNTHLITTGKGNKLDTNIILYKDIMRTITGFKPKNNKCLVYPYSFIRITNNLGSYNDYKIEDFNLGDFDSEEPQDENEIKFNVIGVPCQGYSGKLRPYNYKGIRYNEDESLQLGKYPILSWSSDSFTNWISQNTANIAITAASSLIGAGSAAANAYTGAILSGNSTTNAIASSIGDSGVSASNTMLNLIGNMISSSFIPNTAQGNANSGDISFSQNLNRFKILHMRPKIEDIKIIDDYFSRFGYKINLVKKPNITGRENYNYIEIGSGEKLGFGEIPSNAITRINEIAQKGVTIWHNHANIGNFEVSNNII